MTSDVRVRLSVSGQAQVQEAIGQVDRRLGSLSTTASTGVTALTRFRGAFVALPISVAVAARALIGAGDAATQLNNQLRLATGGAQSAAEAYRSLYTIAQNSRAGFADLGSTFASMSRSTAQLGVSQARLLTVTEVIGNAMAVSGGSAQGMNAALVQLGQGFASGVLRGEELNSVMEQTPRLAQAIADGLGVTIGQLRAMGAAGELTAQRVVVALESQAAVLRGEVQSSVMTVAQAWTLLGNASVRAAAEANKSAGDMTGALARAMQAASADIDRLSDAMGRTAGEGRGAARTVLELTGRLISLGAVRMFEGSWNTMNGVINAVTGSVFELNENLDLLPFALQSTAEQARTLGARAAEASAALDEMYKRRDAGDNDFRLKNDIFQLQEYIKELRAAKVARDALLGVVAASVPSGDVALGRAQRAQYDGEVKALTAFRTEFASAAQKAEAEVKAWREKLGAQFTPEVEATIRAKFKGPKKVGGPEQTEATRFVQELEAQQEALVQQYITLTAGAEAFEAYRAAQLGVVDAAARQAPTLNALRGAVAEVQEETKAGADAIKAYQAESERALRVDQQRAEAAEDDLRRTLEQNESIGQTAAQIQALTATRLDDAAATIEQRLQNAGLAREAPALALSLEREAKALRDRAAAMREGATLRGAADAWEAESDRMKRINDQIGQSLSDALMQGGKSASEYIKNLFRTMILRPTIEAAVRPIVGSFGSMFGMGGGGSAIAGGGAGAGGGGVGLGGFGGLGAAFGTFGSSFGAGAALVGAGATGTAFSTAGTLIGSGQYASGLGVGAGAAAPFLAAYGIGSMAGRAIGGGYATGGSGNTMINTGAVIGTIFGGPIGTAIGAAIGGAVNRAFGRKAPEVRGTGITGQVGGDGFVGNTYSDWVAKGGLFRSDKSGRDLSAVGSDLQSSIDAQVSAVYSATQGYAAALGLPVDAAKNFSASFALAWGDSEAANDAAIAAAVGALGEDLAALYAAPLAEFRRAGETLAQTLQRVGVLELFSDALDALGGVFSRLAALSVDAREQVIALAGGMETLSGQALSFVENYFSGGEQAGLRARAIQTSLSGVGLNGSGLTSRADFRALVDGLDLGTDAGRRQLAVLLEVQGEYALLADAMAGYAQQFGSTGERLAAQGASVAGQFERLGVAMPTSAAQFRALVDGIDTSTDAGRTLRSSLMALSGEFGGLLEALQDTTRGIADEIARIQGLQGGQGATLASAQARFAVATAQARAGDQAAIEALPGLSQSLLALAGESARSNADLARIQAQTLASLQATLQTIARQQGLEIPGFAAGGLHRGGLRIVGERGPELEATGPSRIFTAQQTRDMLGGGGDLQAVVVELRGLRSENAELRAELRALREDSTAENQAIAAHTGKTARILERVTPNGDAIITEAAA